VSFVRVKYTAPMHGYRLIMCRRRW